MLVRRVTTSAARRLDSVTTSFPPGSTHPHLPIPPRIPPPLPARCRPPSAFTRADIERVRATLLPAPRLPLSALPPHTQTLKDRTPRDAAILIPLCNIQGQASLLMEIRAAAMRVHAGEASFPGGKCEETDATLVDSALRETHEELALPPAHVEILGGLPPEYSLGNKSRVWPVIGFVHGGERAAEPTGDAPLASLALSSLVPERDEVSALLPLPLSAVADPARQVPHYFRLNGRWPYYKIRADDYVVPPAEGPAPPTEGLEVWGLSAWFLSRLCLRNGWADTPPVSLPTDAEHDSR